MLPRIGVSSTKMSRWFSIALLCWLVVAACGAPPDEPRVAPARAVRRDIDELQRIAHTPRGCERDADCPGGSHCGDGRCAWACFADSDCGDDRACSARGECVEPEAAGAIATVTSSLAADAPACLAIPLADRLAALDGLATNPAVCFDDADCPCGAYCANDATCRFDCYHDAPALPPFCPPGEACTVEGRCALASGADDPAIIADLELAPDIVEADTATAAVVVPLEARIRARLAGQLAQAPSVTVRFEIAETGSPLPRLRCAATAAFAASCELGAGWVMGSGGDPLRSAPRALWVELPQTTEAAGWTVIARSEWSDTPVSIAVLARPVVEPPHETGHFTGTLTWPQPGGAPLSVPIEAEVTATRAVLFEPGRLLLPTGHAVLSRAAAETTVYAWLRPDHPTAVPHATALLDVESWAFAPAEERITAGVRLTLGNGPAPTALALTMTYARPTTAAACGAGAGCEAGSYCNAEVGLCLPGTQPPTTIIPDGFQPGSELFSAQREAWAAATGGLRAATPALAGNDIIGMERAVCFDQPTQTAPGAIGSSSATPSLDALCADGSRQQVFPFADRTSAVIEDGSGGEIFNLLDTCLDELAVAPAPPFTPANLLQKKQCVSLARFMLATSTPSGAPSGPAVPQIARRRLHDQLIRQWVTLHGMIARGATREYEYDEAVLGEVDQPMHERLGAVVDAIERGWRQVIRGKRTDAAEQAVARQPDARLLGRPVAHWTFNQHLDGPVDDVENQHDMRITGYPLDMRDLKSLSAGAMATCKTDAMVALPARHFSLLAWLGISGTPADYTLIDKTTSVDFFRIRVTNQDAGHRRVEVSSGVAIAVGRYTTTAQAVFSVPAEAGYYAFVADGNRSRILTRRFNPSGPPVIQEIAPNLPAGEPHWGVPGQVRLGCQSPSGVALIDEVSLWDRPLPLETVAAFGARYSPTGAQNPPQVSLPPGALTRAASDEQAQGLAVHLVDAAAAHMELMSAYLRAERGELFAECGAATVGPARSRVLDRVGRALRFAALVENDARDIVALAGAAAAPWQARFDSTSQLLAGERAEVVRQLELATRCGNPLGIASDDLPLFHGEEAGASARFFASSRFLAREAREQIAASTAELELARGAWQQQRASAFQIALGAAEKAERIRRIENEYEGVLRRLCGAPGAGAGTLLAGFGNQTVTHTSCFLKLELPGCAGAETMPVRSVPAGCLRGEIGEQILEVQGAEIDARNADNAHERAIGQYDAEMSYCTRREDFHEETERIRTAHAVHMIELRNQRRNLMVAGGFIKAAVNIFAGGFSGNPGMVISGFAFPLDVMETEMRDDEQSARDSHQRVLAARAEALDLMACFHGADNQKFAIDAARDVITRAYHNTKGAILRLENLQAELRALLDQAAGDLELEQSMVRVLPHHHYWLDEHIDAYRRHFRYAQRLTFLALRALEYESQQSLGHDAAVIAARTPAVLDEVVLEIEQRVAPMQGEQGYVVGEFAPVMSLRDEILRLGTPEAPPGFPQLSSIAALREHLASDAAKIYAGGQYVGRGVRFSLRPPPWAQLSCAERIWRITTALQVEGSPINNARLLLWQENSFASQRCRAAEHGELHVARIRPEHNLLVGDGGNHDGSSFVRPLRFTAMETTGLGNLPREQLAALPEGLHAGFAGRGLYANYVLLFPSLQFDNPAFLSTVKDVLIRFDIVEVTNAGGDPNP